MVSRARRGDVSAFERLVESHQEVAMRTAYLIAGPEAEDATQEAMVKAYRALGRFREGAPFRPWLLRIVANEARNRRRGMVRRDQLALRLAAGPSDESPSPESSVVRNDEIQRLLRALDNMRDEDRLIIGYRYLMDLSEEEIATAMSVRRGTVKSRLSRAMARLREAVATEAASV